MLLNEINTEQPDSIKQLKLLVDTKFSEAFHSGASFLRGVSAAYFERFANTIVDPTQHNRKSVWDNSDDYNELLTNLPSFPGWENIHPRRTAMIGTPSHRVANEWGRAVHVLPQNGSTVSVADKDFNEGVFAALFSSYNDSEDDDYNVFMPSTLPGLMRTLTSDLSIPTTYDEVKKCVDHIDGVFESIKAQLAQLPTKEKQQLIQLLKNSDQYGPWETIRFAQKHSSLLRSDNLPEMIHVMFKTLVYSGFTTHLEAANILDRFKPETFNIRTIPITAIPTTTFKPSTEFWTSDTCLILSQATYNELKTASK